MGKLCINCEVEILFDAWLGAYTRYAFISDGFHCPGANCQFGNVLLEEPSPVAFRNRRPGFAMRRRKSGMLQLAWTKTVACLTITIVGAQWLCHSPPAGL